MTACSPASAFHVFIRCSCLLIVAVVSCIAAAEETVHGIQDPFARYGNPCYLELSGTDELCGWVELGTHDSLPTPTTQIPVLPVSTIESSVTVVATAACARAGVYVEQIVEPFAMVGPCFDNSLETVNRLQQWWNTAVDQAKSLNSERATAEARKSDEMDSRVDALAAMEPIDVESLGPSVVTWIPEIERPTETDRSKNLLVGSSPMIVTLEEPYLPYDLAAKDIKLWSVFPVTTRPFCVRARARQVAPRNIWEDGKRIVHQGVEVIRASDAYAYCGSVDCHLDELIWQFDNLIADDSELREMVHPRAIGRRFAELAFSGESLVKDAAELLASRWPKATEKEVSPSPAGAALLARAGVINEAEPIASAEPIAEPEARVADAEAGASLR